MDLNAKPTTKLALSPMSSYTWANIAVLHKTFGHCTDDGGDVWSPQPLDPQSSEQRWWQGWLQCRVKVRQVQVLTQLLFSNHLLEQRVLAHGHLWRHLELHSALCNSKIFLASRSFKVQNQTPVSSIFSHQVHFLKINLNRVDLLSTRVLFMSMAAMTHSGHLAGFNVWWCETAMILILVNSSQSLKSMVYPYIHKQDVSDNTKVKAFIVDLLLSILTGRQAFPFSSWMICLATGLKKSRISLGWGIYCKKWWSPCSPLNSGWLCNGEEQVCLNHINLNTYKAF